MLSPDFDWEKINVQNSKITDIVHVHVRTCVKPKVWIKQAKYASTTRVQKCVRDRIYERKNGTHCNFRLELHLPMWAKVVDKYTCIMQF